jgi:ribosomal protein S18 acetylase RimI-like enzyme
MKLAENMDIEIKQLVAGDDAVLSRVAIDVFDEAIDANWLAAYLAEETHHMIVAIKNGEVVGQIRAILHKYPDRADELYIDNLGVTPSLQRQGIASKLLNAILELGKKLGCEDAWLATERDNIQAKGFYESYGVKAEAMVFYLFKL